MTLNRKVAVTGGIGSGKSEACRILSEKGYRVLSCDEIYTELLNTREFSAMIENQFPRITDENGKIDRKKLSAIVFADRHKLHELTDLTNPAIIKEAMARMKKIQGTVICEVPLLFENGFEKYFDDVIIILRDYDKRIESIIKRSNLTEKDARERIDSQFNYSSLNLSMYYVIHNDKNLLQLNADVTQIMNKIEQKN